MTDTFALISAQRRAVADVLESLSPDEWRSASLCKGWRIQEMAAHLTMPFRVSNLRFFLGVLGSGGSIAKVMDKYAKVHSGEPPAQLVGFLRDGAESHFVPPTFPTVASLNEIVVHGFDVAIPTGRHVEVPEEVSRLVLDYLVSPKAGTVHTKRGLANGVRLVSTDSEWSWGTGPEVRGTNFGLIMLLARRPIGFEHVSGEGVDLIRRHLALG
ncbi:MAG TPA: maleylpyruvate isomerase family mycothiol-dependent enzyme [Acidimicrobiales bacterium]